MTQTITTQPLREAQKRAALTIINAALGEDPVIADQHSEMVSADLLDYQIMRELALTSSQRTSSRVLGSRHDARRNNRIFF
jgi:hypothetical protein